MKNLRGSAIIIAMLLVTAVATVAFSIGRLFFIDTSLAYIYENSIIAYYTAESGIEQGYLAYRYNRNNQIICTDNSQVNRINLSSSDSQGCLNISDDIIENEQIYDLKMTYKSDFYGADVFPSGSPDGKITADDIKSNDYKKYPQYYIPYDESIKIDITDIYKDSDGTAVNSRDLDLFFIVDESNNCHSGYNEVNTFIEVKVLGDVPQGFKEQKVAITTYNNPNIIPHIQANSSSSIPVVYFQYDFLADIRLSTSAGYFILNNPVELYLKPVGCSIYFALQPERDCQISSPYTTVKSTGYSGNVSRTLESRIDRQAGTVYDLYDFVILEHN